jgi:uncharacterized protein
MRSFLLTVLLLAAIAAGICLIVGVLLWRVQERIVFQPPGPPYPGGQGARRIDFHAADGQPLFAYLAGELPGNGLVLVFHGNADLAAWQIPWATELSRRTGRAVLIAEFRGYAGLSGTPTYAGSGLDAHAVYALARDTLGVPPERIALYGHSLGSAIATELAREVHPEALVLVAPFTSARAMAHRIAPGGGLLYRVGLSRVRYDAESIVRTLDTPVWVVHGSRDTVIPVEMGRHVFAAARVPGELLVLETAGHSDVAEEGGARYWAWISRALQPRDRRP